MALTCKKGTDIFKEVGDLYLITVNVIGVMGAGVAKSFKEKFPDLFQKYKHDCRMGIITIGHPVIYKGDDNRHYMMFPTKEHFKDGSQEIYIAKSLQWMAENIGTEDGIDPNWKIIMPPLGCANGGLSLLTVKPMIERFSQDIPNEIVLVHPAWMLLGEDDWSN